MRDEVIPSKWPYLPRPRRKRLPFLKCHKKYGRHGSFFVAQCCNQQLTDRHLQEKCFALGRPIKVNQNASCKMPKEEGIIP
jgi:hypothetical protein